MSKVSICVPVWEAYGRGESFLRNILFALADQSFKDFNLCVSDQSNTDKLFEVCQEYASEVQIIYCKNQDNPGFITNVNSVIELGQEVGSEIIKILFQDDFILTPTVVEETYMQMTNSPQHWAVCGFAHTIDEGRTHYNAKIPVWNDDIIRGVNTFSSPSILSMKKDSIEYFDENLTMLMDCEMYYRLHSKYGEPLIMQQIHISNREHQNQTSRLMQSQEEFDKALSNEVEYCLLKHNLK